MAQLGPEGVHDAGLDHMEAPEQQCDYAHQIQKNHASDKRPTPRIHYVAPQRPDRKFCWLRLRTWLYPRLKAATWPLLLWLERCCQPQGSGPPWINNSSSGPAS